MTKSTFESIREESSMKGELTKEQAIATGYIRAIEDFGIWKDGTQTIGCMNNSVKELRAAIREEFKL